MGSVVHRPVGVEVSRPLFEQLEAQCRASIAATGNVDVPALALSLKAHLAGPHGEQFALLLAAFVARGLEGIAPDFRTITP